MFVICNFLPKFTMIWNDSNTKWMYPIALNDAFTSVAIHFSYGTNTMRHHSHITLNVDTNTIVLLPCVDGMFLIKFTSGNFASSCSNMIFTWNGQWYWAPPSWHAIGFSRRHFKADVENVLIESRRPMIFHTQEVDVWLLVWDEMEKAFF